MNPKSISFTVLLLLALLTNTSQVNSQFSLYVTVQTDKTAYAAGELANITGNVTFEGELVQDGLIGIQIENAYPHKTIVLRTLPLTTNLSGDFYIKITSFFPCNEIGQEIDPITKRNSHIWFTMTVENDGFTNKAAHVSITIVDSELVPLETDRANFTVVPGIPNEFRPRMYIPDWATVGTAFVYANVYNSWPKDGGRPLCPEKISCLNIIESAYSADPSKNMSPNQPAQNGTYETVFRLPPDMTQGGQITASAWSRGYTGSSSTSFGTIHNIAVMNIQCPTEVYNDWLAPVTVTMQNKGTSSETFTVTLYSNSSFIETKQVTNLGPRQNIDLTFTWNTTGSTLCANYTLQAIADTVENETDTTDNTLECGPIWIKMLGDVDGDREIDIFDVVKVTYIYKSKEGDSNWNLMADLKRDGTINIYDVVIVCIKYNTSY